MDKSGETADWAGAGSGAEAERSQLLRQRAAELELDVLVAHELATGGPAAAVIWRRAGWDPPTDQVTVDRQVARDDGRTTDIVARAGSQVLYCENKAVDGQFEDGQCASYADHLKRNLGAAVLVAPRRFVDAAAESWPGIVVFVEDLAHALMEAASQFNDDNELCRSYRWRGKTLSNFAAAKGYTLLPDSGVVAFANKYRDIAERVAGGEAQVSPSSLQGKGAGFAHYKVPITGVSLIHKLRYGSLDLLTRRRWELHRLKYWLEGLPATDQPPGSPRIRKSDKGRPLLSWSVPTVDVTGSWSSAAEDSLTVVVKLAAAILRWLETPAGGVLAAGGDGAAVDTELRRAKYVAQLVGDIRLDAIDTLIDSNARNLG